MLMSSGIFIEFLNIGSVSNYVIRKLLPLKLLSTYFLGVPTKELGSSGQVPRIFLKGIIVNFVS